MQSLEEEIREFIKVNYNPECLYVNLSADFQRPITAVGAEVVSQEINWPIKTLNLNLYHIQDLGMQAIINAGEQWPTLNEIRLQKNQISCEGLKNIGKCNWRQLKKLYLNNNKIKSKGFQEIVSSQWPELTHLSLSHCQIGAESCSYFKQINWPQLEFLNLNYNLIGNEGLRQLSHCKFEHLRILELSNNKLDGKAMSYLSKMALQSLESLCLNRNQIGREKASLCEIGCIYLSKIQVGAGLKSLHIFGNDITLTGVRHILYSGKLRENCFLEIIRNNFTYADIKTDIEELKLFCNHFD